MGGVLLRVIDQLGLREGKDWVHLCIVACRYKEVDFCQGKLICVLLLADIKE